MASLVPGIANGADITVRQLLTMTAGVFDDIADPFFARSYQADPAIALTLEQPLAIMRKHPADFTQKAQVRYANCNTYLLGLIIEQVSGQSAGAVITARLMARWA